MADGFNISRFTSKTSERGFLKTNKFLIRIPVPAGLVSSADNAYYTATSRDFEYWAEGAAVPGVALSMHTVQRYGYGIMEKKPFMPMFNDMNISILGDAAAQNWYWMQDWINLTVKHNATRGIDPPREQINTNGAITGGARVIAPYEVSYRKDYVVDANIIVYDDAGNSTKSIILHDCFPSMVGEMQLNWMDNNNIARIPITLTYLDWFYQ